MVVHVVDETSTGRRKQGLAPNGATADGKSAEGGAAASVGRPAACRSRSRGLGSGPTGLAKTRLEVADDHAELAPGQKPRPKGTRRVLTDGRKGSQCDASLCGEVFELPADLVFDGSWPIRIPEAGGLGGIRGGTQRVGAHVADADGLTGGSGSGRCSGRRHLTSTDPTDKTAADLFRRAQLSSGERASPGDERPRPAIIWSLGLEQPENPLGTVSGPCGDETSVGFTQRLRRPHHPDSTEPSRPQKPGEHHERHDGEDLAGGVGTGDPRSGPAGSGRRGPGRPRRWAGPR